MKHLHILAVILSMGLLLATSANGVSRFDHTKPAGVYLAVGFSAGPAEVHFSDRRKMIDSKNAFGRNLRIGFVVHPRLLVGFEYNNWLKDQQGTDYLYQHCSVAASYYFSQRLFVKAGIAMGFVSHKLDDTNDYDITYSEMGAGLGFGVGVDIHLTRSLSLVPAVQYNYLDFKNSAASQIAAVIGLGWFW